jgi:hypothetical protein
MGLEKLGILMGSGFKGFVLTSRILRLTQKFNSSGTTRHFSTRPISLYVQTRSSAGSALKSFSLKVNKAFPDGTYPKLFILVKDVPFTITMHRKQQCHVFHAPDGKATYATTGSKEIPIPKFQPFQIVARVGPHKRP